MKRVRCVSKKYDPNDIVQCKCGCGLSFTRLDKEGREREYLSGHNTPIKYDDPTQFKREWNHRNREKRFKSKVNYGRQRKVKLIMFMGGECISCGASYNGKNASMFDAHHVNPEDKKFALSINGLVNNKWDKIIEESKKCFLLCSCCHRLVHSAEY